MFSEIDIGFVGIGSGLAAYGLWRVRGVNSGMRGRLLEEFSRLDSVLRQEMTQTRQEAQAGSRQAREELQSALERVADRIGSSVKEFKEAQEGGLEALTRRLSEISMGNETRLRVMTEVLERKLSELQSQNALKLDEIRATVDDKLQKTLNERLVESFKQVSDNLEAVNRGLGEMKGLASGVGDLKKVLSNVKTRGILGEIQLGNILEQVFSPTQYDKNVITKSGSRDHVEFAIKLPGREVQGSPVWLPVDSKFPLEPYEKLLTAYDTGQADLVRVASRELEAAIKKSAKDIRDKYVDPPGTTDFGILFLPIEGLFAEVVRQPALMETLHRDFRVAVTGPTTLAAFLNSLQMGFQTLAFEKRSQEIRDILGAVKKEFGTFGQVLDDVQKRLSGASDDLERLVGTRTRKIQGKLRSVEELPDTQAKALLDWADDS